MVQIFIIAFREFLEAFLAIGVLFSISAKFNLKRTDSILIGAILGFFVIVLLASVVFGIDTSFIQHLPKNIFTLIEGWLFVFSALFIAYAVFSLHKILRYYSTAGIKQIEAKSHKFKESFWLLPITAFLFIFKEGLEGIFFNVTNGIFYPFWQDVLGFSSAFLGALIIGVVIKQWFQNFPIQRIFKITEVFIIFVGVDALNKGVTLLTAYYFKWDSSPYDMLLALLYIVFIYEFFIKEKTLPTR